MAIDKIAIEKKVNESLDQLRPFLEADGGDLELVEIQDDATVVVRLLGTCKDCSMSLMTLKVGFFILLVTILALEVKAVVALNMPEAL